jgi:hypothetical protein
VSSANSLPKPVILSATSFIQIRKSNGPKTDPWGTPTFNSPVLDIAFLITYIRIFSTSHLENNSIFDFSDISLSPVHMHKHLGVIFSIDFKWTKHIDVLIEKTSKQLNILNTG